MKIKILNFVAAMVVLTLLGYGGGKGVNFIISWWQKDKEDRLIDINSKTPFSFDQVDDSVMQSIKKELIKSRWNEDAAEAVVKLNGEFFTIQKEENPGAFNLNLKFLCNLGSHPEYMGLIKNHPELASLLAFAKDPINIASCFEKVTQDEYPILASSFVQFVDKDDANLIAFAMNNNRDLICDLTRRGQLCSELPFMFDYKKPGAEEYNKWLSEVLRSKLKDSTNEEFASFYHMILMEGAKIRKKMESDIVFRDKFSNEFWPRLLRISSEQKGMLEVYFQTNDKRIWDVLALPNGEELVAKLGYIPINLLYGEPELNHEPYPKDLHDIIVQILLNIHNNEAVVNALFKFRDDPNFKKLLGRKLSPDCFSAVCSNLLKSGTSYPSLLIKYEKLSDNALSEEVGPPTSGLITWVPFYYTVYEVPKKILQGRDPTGMDLLSAVADPAFLAIDIFSAGGGTITRKILQTGSKEALEKIPVKGADKAVVMTLRSTGLEIAEKQLPKQIVEKMNEKELVGFTITAFIAEMKNSIATTIGKITTFEITKPLQMFFKLSGVGAKTTKRITGLDARIFMRGDAKVYVRLGKVPTAILGTKIVAFLNRTSGDLALGTVVESGPGQKVIEDGVHTVAGLSDNLRKVEWQKHISAWWLINSN